MNGRKSKAIRRTAKHIAGEFPLVHSVKSYQDIVRQKTITREVVDENILQKGLRILGKVLGKKAKPKPKTKLVETMIDETRTTILSAGWRFIQQRLKASIRRGDATINSSGVIEATNRGLVTCDGVPQ